MVELHSQMDTLNYALRLEKLKVERMENEKKLLQDKIDLFTRKDN